DMVRVLSPSSPAKIATPVGALPRIRLAEPFERLRDWSDDYLAAHGNRPKIFLACLGRPADFNAPASFAKSLFESGGIEAEEASGDHLRGRVTESGARLACLCSSDKLYASEAVATAKALVAAGAKYI